jgi:branched-chain amino acid transport system substrate-binding protein
MSQIRKPAAALAALAATALVAAGCGSSSSSNSASSAPAAAATSSSSTSSGSSGASASALGTPKKATGSPYVFGGINDETGPVTFPEARQAEIAAAGYVNNYLGGINGHPIVLDDCISDGTAPTSARCAGELVSKHPLAILGAADTGTPGSEPVYQRAGLAYIGGIPFTPVEQNAPNSVQFWSVSLGDNAAASVYAAKSLGVKSAAVMYFDNSQGKVAGLGIIPPVMKAAGISNVKTVGVPPTTPDPSPEVASVLSSHPDAVYVDIPNNCGVVLKDLKSLGYSGKLIGIDPCTSPQAIASAAGAAQGMYVATPFVSAFGGSPEANVLVAALNKYAAKNTPIDSIAEAGFATVMNLRSAMASIKGTPTTTSLLAAFKTGSNHQNFMSHPYTCNGQAVAKAASICNDYYLIEQIQGSKPVIANANDWVTSKGYFHGL